MTSSDNELRLQKIIAMSGYCSRRKAEEYIEQGVVKVNGSVITQLGYKASLNDEITVKGMLIKEESTKVYYLLNKPKGIISSSSDTHNRTTVVDLIDDERRIFSVGRLDKETTGALILTNDGEFANVMTHPSYDLTKEYRVSVKGELTFDIRKNLQQGVRVEGVDYRSVTINSVKYDSTKNRTQFTIILTEGKNRQIRKLLDHFKLPVLKLHRFKIGTLELNDLQIGAYRKLKPFEIKQLMQGAKGKI